MNIYRRLSASLFIFLFCIFASIVSALCRPVVVIPGIEGSKLCDASGNVLWGDRNSYTAARINALRLPPDLASHDKGIHSCGLIESVSIIPLLWDSNVYSGLIATLRGAGYQDKDIVVFDYDWRLSNFETAKLLRDKIDKLPLGPDGQVDIIAHSMGGLVARIYLQTMNGFAHVHNLILMGTPSFGSAKIFQNLRDGFDHWPNAWSGGLDEIQRTILSFPSTYELLPTYRDCCGFTRNGDANHARYEDILDPSIWKRFSWLPADLRAGPRSDATATYLADAKRLKVLMQSPISTNPDETPRIHYIGNGFLYTWSRVFFDEQTGAIVGSVLRPGDGTVLLFSATNGNPGQVQVSHKEHELVFMGVDPELVINAVLANRNWTAGSVEFSQTLEDAQGKKFRVESAGLSLSPRAAEPGGSIKLRLNLNGTALNLAELSNASVDILRDSEVIIHTALQNFGSDDKTRSLGADLKVPDQPGVYEVKVSLRGVDGLEAIFVVIGP